MNLMKTDIKKILVMRLDRLGDIILSIPALRALRKEFPQSEITLLVYDNLCGLTELKKYSDEIIGFKKENIFKIIYELRKKNFDMAIDFLSRADNMSAIILGAMRAKEKLGFNVGMRRLFLSIKFRPHNIELYEVDTLLKMLEKLDIETNDNQLELSLDINEEEFVNLWLIKNNVEKNDILIGINPFAGDMVKMWPIEKFVELVKLITNKYPVKIILTGSDNEAGKIKSVFKYILSKKVISSAGEVSLNGLVTLIDRFKMLISGNTGPMHIAITRNIPLLLINGYSSLKRWGPHEGNNLIIKKDYPCVPCELRGGKCIYGDYRCMNEISVDEVFLGFEKLWRQVIAHNIKNKFNNRLTNDKKDQRKNNK